jgi:hypothetical protein
MLEGNGLDFKVAGFLNEDAVVVEDVRLFLRLNS